MNQVAQTPMQNHDLFDAANAALEAGNQEAAIALFRQSYDSGDVWAINSIGHCYDNGLGVQKNRCQAVAWYRKAAQLGDVAACANLAPCHKNAGNIRQAKTWLRRAINLQDHDAAVDLAKILLQSDSKRRRSAAMKYLRIAIESTGIIEHGREEALRLQTQLSERAGTT